MSRFIFENAEDREQFEENRAELIENAWDTYNVSLEVYSGDVIRVHGALSDIVDFYQDFRSEIEEVI